MSTVLDAMPTLGDALGGAKPTLTIKGRSRVHRMGDDADEAEPAPPVEERSTPEPIITPFLEPKPRESAMPTGQYDRSKAKKRKPRTSNTEKIDRLVGGALAVVERGAKGKRDAAVRALPKVMSAEVFGKIAHDVASAAIEYARAKKAWDAASAQISAFHKLATGA